MRVAIAGWRAPLLAAGMRQATGAGWWHENKKRLCGRVAGGRGEAATCAASRVGGHPRSAREGKGRFLAARAVARCVTPTRGDHGWVSSSAAPQPLPHLSAACASCRRATASAALAGAAVPTAVPVTSRRRISESRCLPAAPSWCEQQPACVDVTGQSRSRASASCLSQPTARG